MKLWPQECHEVHEEELIRLQDVDISSVSLQAHLMPLLHSSVFSTRASELISEHKVPGLALALVHHGHTSSTALGQACLDPPRPCRTDSLFDIASASKSLTAASVALLVADNENHPDVQWHAKMSHLLPDDFVMQEQSYTNDVTVEDILSHRTGLPS